MHVRSTWKVQAAFFAFVPFHVVFVRIFVQLHIFDAVSVGLAPSRAGFIPGLSIVQVHLRLSISLFGTVLASVAVLVFLLGVSMCCIHSVLSRLCTQ